MPYPGLEDHLTPAERAELAGLSSPAAIQAFLDSVPYSPENANLCPRQVLAQRRAHCLDGALFGAAALRRLGHPPLVVDLLPDPGTDDDHVLAIYRHFGHWGAVAKSNFTGLRYREPIHRSLRELALSYFEDFYNIRGEKTLRAYTRPVNLAAFDRLGWEWQESGADAIERRLWRATRVPLITPLMAAELRPVDRRAYDAGMFGADPSGIYQPRN